MSPVVAFGSFVLLFRLPLPKPQPLKAHQPLTQVTATTASAAKTMAPKRMAMSLAELLKSPEAPSADQLEKWFTKDPKKQLQQNHINMKPNN